VTKLYTIIKALTLVFQMCNSDILFHSNINRILLFVLLLFF
jgi:hypothetical protein